MKSKETCIDDKFITLCTWWIDNKPRKALLKDITSKTKAVQGLQTPHGRNNVQ